MKTHTVGPRIWQEKWKMRHKHCRIRNMVRNTQKGGK